MSCTNPECVDLARFLRDHDSAWDQSYLVIEEQAQNFRHQKARVLSAEKRAEQAEAAHAQSERRVEELKQSMVEHFQRDHLAGDGPEIDRWKRRAQEAEAERDRFRKMMVRASEQAQAAKDEGAEDERLWRRLEVERDAARAEARALRERLEEARGLLYGVLHASDGMEPWEAIRAFLAAPPAPAAEPPLPKCAVCGKWAAIICLNCKVPPASTVCPPEQEPEPPRENCQPETNAFPCGLCPACLSAGSETE